MIDQRRNQEADINVRVQEFIDAAELNGFKVTYKKQTNTKSVLVLERNGFVEQCDLDHAIVCGKSYFNTIWKPMIWDMHMKILKAEGKPYEQESK